ncbi:MAG: hypothetical protein P8180_05710 [Gammaproteobacteria bacterium]
MGEVDINAFRPDDSDEPVEAAPGDCGPGWRRAGDLHHNVPVWSDPCCCCEAEPYWREVAPELGIDPDGDGGAC